MPQIDKQNKRLLKNTLLLYLRMFLTMSIGLYTSRVVLQVLGIEDFGIYNVVGGVVTMMSFLSTSLTSASQRFISFELGKGNLDSLKQIFGTTLAVHVCLALIVVAIAETIGLWFLNFKMNIPDARMFAANWVFQGSIFVFVVNVISVPYNAVIIAHEKMSAFAYISILEVVLKLLIVFSLLFLPWDKLIVYAILQCLVSISIRFSYTLYCKRHFNEINTEMTFEKKQFMHIFSFAGWAVLGNMGFTMKDQLSNIVLNLFFGPAVNAARAIGMQVSSLLSTFVNNFGMALNPQITKQYAAGNIARSSNLVYVGARCSFCLMMLISLPVVLNIDYVLKIWLGNVPLYASEFMILSVIVSLIYSVSGTASVAIQATGNMKAFQIGICVILLMELPIAYLLLKMGCKPYVAVMPSLVTYSITVFYRFYLLKKYVETYEWHIYINDVLLRCMVLCAFCSAFSYYVKSFFEDNIVGLLSSSILMSLGNIAITFIFGVKKSEKLLLINYIKAKLWCKM